MVARQIETPAQTEDRMVGKAFMDGVEARRLSTGQYVTRSDSTPIAVTYITSTAACTCLGWQRHGHCKHRAMVRFLESERTPEPPTAPAACPLCNDTGRVRKVNRYRPDLTFVGMCDCQRRVA